MTNGDLSRIRQEYRLSRLDEHDVDPDPFLQFGKWMDDAIRAGIEEPTAMALATVSRDGKPSARMVLLKDFDSGGLTFFTNYLSRKGREMEGNPHVALLFFWKELEREVRIEGMASKISASESDAYFHTRPEGSQAGAIISPQSEVISGREFLEKKLADYMKSSRGKHRRPDHWGGYRVSPSSVEFWQGRADRLHDRLWYSLEAGRWIIRRLAP